MKHAAWIPAAKAELKTFPAEVQDRIGFALHEAQIGGKSDLAKPLHGFGGAGILEIVADYSTDTYRAIYTVKLQDVVYVLHCFQKKSKRGGEMTQQDKELIRQRLAAAKALHAKHSE